MWIPISTYPSTEVTENVFDFRLGTLYANSGHCWYTLSVPGRLAHIFTISRPVPSRQCTRAQSLPHDGPPHSQQEVGTDPKTEIPFFSDTSSAPFPSRSLQLWIDITNQALICSFLLSQGGCAHTWQIRLGLCVHIQNGSSGTAASLNIGISMF